MQIITLEDENLSQFAYLVACPASGEAVVVDPPRDIDRVIDRARDEGFSIVAVTETHIHADFACGARDLARHLGAKLYVSGEVDPDWEYRNLDGLDATSLKHNDRIEIGNVTLEALHTPGHTPEHLAFLVHDSGTPRMLLTGDFVFVGDLGRPDLLDAAGESGTAETMARNLFDSLKSVFCEIPDEVTLWPGHGAGSSCGKGMSALPISSVGYEKRHAWWSDHVREDDSDGFVNELLDGQPEVPTYYPRMKYGNRDGFEKLAKIDMPGRLLPAEIERLHDADAQFIDVRELTSFASSHVEGALNMGLSSVADLAGWYIDAERDVVLIGEREDVFDATRQLIRIAIDRVVGWARHEDTSQAPQASHKVLSNEEALEARKKGASLLDVRARSEWNEGHFEGAVQIHHGKLVDQLDDVPYGTLIVHCASGARATAAASYLQSKGLEDVHVMVPGYTPSTS